MADQWAPVTPRKTPRRWTRRLRWIAGAVAVGSVVLYFFVTSHFFLRAFVLPKVSSAAGVPVSAGDASISPFRKVVLREVRVGGSAFEEPIVAVREVRVRYSLWDIIGGNINVQEVTLVSPVVQIVKYEDGTSNLDPLSRSKEKPQGPAETGEATRFQLGRFLLTNATVRYKSSLGGVQDSAELSGINISAADLGTGRAGTLNVGASMRFERTPVAGTTNIAAELIEAKIAASFELALDSDMKPENVRGSTTLDVTRPPAAAADLKGTSAVLECDLTPTEVRQLSLRLKQGERMLGQIVASGPFDLQTKEGRINLQVTSIGRHALNLAGAASGLDFGSTTLNATQQVTLANGGQVISAVGRLAADKLSVARAGKATPPNFGGASSVEPTPPLDLKLDYSVTVDQQQKWALIERFMIAGEQESTPIINGALDRAMQVQWGAGTNAMEESAFSLQITNLNLADWRAFVGDVSGRASAGLQVTTGNAGKEVRVRLDSRLGELGLALGSNRIERAEVELALRGVLTGFEALRVDDFTLRLGRGLQNAATLVATAHANIKQQQAEISLGLEADAREMGNLLLATNLPAGGLKVNALAYRRGSSVAVSNLIVKFQPVSGALSEAALDAIYDLAATNGTASLRAQLRDVLAFAPTNPAPGKPFSLDLACTAELAPNVASLRNLTCKIDQGGRAGGVCEASGRFELLSRAGNLNLKFGGVNEAALAPFVDPVLGQGRALRSCAIDAAVEAQYSAQGVGAVKTDLQLARLVIFDPTSQIPGTPMGASIKFAGSVGNDQAVVDSLSADFTMANAKGGEIRAAGKYHLKNKRAEGSLRVVDLNERLLGPFTAGALTNKQLSSVSISADVAGRYDPAGDAAVKGELSVSNLMLAERGRAPQGDALSAALNVSAQMGKDKVLDLQALRLQLAPTPRARNEVNVSGKLDLSRTNVFSGEMQLVADALDLTRYYEMYAPGGTTNRAPVVAQQTPQPSTASPQPKAPPSEPQPVSLPFRNFSFTASIGQLYLRDVAIHNWQTGFKADGSQVQITPLELRLNGSQIRGAATLDLGVPGYKYDLTLATDRIGLAPVIDSFAPAQRGRVKGELIFTTRVKGAGVTGRNLQKNLAGDVAVNFTNANLTLATGPIKGFFNVVGLFIGVPDLANSPISWLTANARLGEGKISVTQFNLLSEAFSAETQGDIKIAEILGDSPIEKWPMHLSLRRGLAQRIGKIPRNTPRDAEYVKMPDFVRVAGTVSSPKPDLNRLALAGAVAEKFLDGALKESTGGFNPLNPLGK